MTIYCPLAEALSIDASISILDIIKNDNDVHSGLKGVKYGPQSEEHLKNRSLSISIAKTGKKRSEWERQAMTEWFSKKWNIKCPDDSVINVKSLRIFCENHGLSYHSMYATYRGKQKKHKGYSLIGYEKTKNHK